MDNQNNIPLSGFPLGFTGNIPSANADITESNSTVNLESEDLFKPQSISHKQSIKSIIKHSGEITGYELSDGEKVTKERGVELAKSGVISGVSVSTSRKGEEYLRSLRDKDETNNLSSLPIINE